MKKIIQYFCFFIFVSMFCLTTPNIIFAGYGDLEFSQDNLDNVSLEQGYGYKFGNLQLLNKLSTKFNEIEKPKEDYGYQVKVPDFVGIPSDNIQNFLKEKAGFNLVDKWQAILPSKEKQEETKSKKKYTEDFLEKLKDLKEKIEEAFGNFIEEVGKDKAFNFNNAFEVTDVDELYKGPSERFMVRSTGREDTKELANAGGNESKSNVIPDSVNILDAMKIVVASYFSEKSLKQRLGAGDPNLFEKTPFTPVLLQWMIGEKDPNKLPKCGVMFTE